MDDRTEPIALNGINLATGEYATAPRTPAEFARIVQDRLIAPEHLNDLMRKKAAAAPSFAPLPGIASDDLAQTGWGVIFPFGADAAVKEALAPLLRLREKQATVKQPLFRVYDGVNGYRNGESKNAFLKRLPHSVGGGTGVAPGPCNPKKMPYYLLIVGSPDEVPYRFQYELDVDYAVGRLSFETVREYADYAAAVTAAEAGPTGLPRRAVLFGARNSGDRSTKLSADHLITPLAAALGPDAPGWEVEPVLGAAATKQALLDHLGGDRTPAVLVTATHGAVLSSGDPLQARRQGALICQDWPGPLVWRRPILDSHYVSADDIADGARVRGLVAFFFACFAAGTPAFDDFADGPTQAPLAPHDLVAALPRRLLGLPGGGALAVIGHIDQAWSYTFQWGGSDDQIDIYQAILAQLLNGIPVGAALEVLNQYYASIATQLSNLQEDIRFGRQTNPVELSGLWAANNDARNFVLLGDPAVRIAAAAPH